MHSSAYARRCLSAGALGGCAASPTAERASRAEPNRTEPGPRPRHSRALPAPNMAAALCPEERWRRRTSCAGAWRSLTSSARAGSGGRGKVKGREEGAAVGRAWALVGLSKSASPAAAAPGDTAGPGRTGRGGASGMRRDRILAPQGSCWGHVP